MDKTNALDTQNFDDFFLDMEPTLNKESTGASPLHSSPSSQTRETQTAPPDTMGNANPFATYPFFDPKAEEVWSKPRRPDVPERPKLPDDIDPVIAELYLACESFLSNSILESQSYTLYEPRSRRNLAVPLSIETSCISGSTFPSQSVT